MYFYKDDRLLHQTNYHSAQHIEIEDIYSYEIKKIHVQVIQQTAFILYYNAIVLPAT